MSVFDSRVSDFQNKLSFRLSCLFTYKFTRHTLLIHAMYFLPDCVRSRVIYQRALLVTYYGSYWIRFLLKLLITRTRLSFIMSSCHSHGNSIVLTLRSVIFSVFTFFLWEFSTFDSSRC